MRSLEIAFRTLPVNDKFEKRVPFSSGDNLFILVEGSGSGQLENLAIKITYSVISDSFSRNLSENNSPGEALVYALEQANISLLKEGEKLGEKMTASVSAIYIKDHIMYLTHEGNSRIYYLHDGNIEQLSKGGPGFSGDTPLENNYGIHGLKRSPAAGIGVYDKLEITVKKYHLHKKGMVVLTTDGFTRRISNHEILWLSHKTTIPDILCDELIGLAGKKGGEGKGNISVGIIRFGSLSKSIRNIIIMAGLFFMLAIIAVAGYFLASGVKEDPEKNIDERLPVVEERLELLEPETPVLIEDQDYMPQVELPLTEKENVGKYEEINNEINAFLMDWKDAWEKSAGKYGNIDNYLSFYSERFRSGIFDIGKWKEDKAIKNSQKKWIRLDISDIRISFNVKEKKAEVEFTQKYSSSNFSSEERKKLIIERDESGMKIISEMSD